jgi:hypothetical protein
MRCRRYVAVAVMLVLHVCVEPFLSFVIAVGRETNVCCFVQELWSYEIDSSVRNDSLLFSERVVPSSED